MADTDTKTSRAKKAAGATKGAAKKTTARKAAAEKPAKKATAKKAAATKSAGRRRGPAELSDSHKEAMAAGREEGRIVREYLEALTVNKPKRGRKRTPESVQARLLAIEERLQGASPFERLGLAQERIDLADELNRMGKSVDLAPIEEKFVKVAQSYTARRGIMYVAWREAGVPADVLKRAGVSRGAGA